MSPWQIPAPAGDRSPTSRKTISRPRRRTRASATASAAVTLARYCTESSTAPRRGSASRSIPVQAASVPAMVNSEALAPPLRTPPAFRCSGRRGSTSTARSGDRSPTVTPNHCANGTRANRARACATRRPSPAGAVTRPSVAARAPRLRQELLADLEPGLGGEGQRLHVDALVVAVESPGHGLGRQGPREEAEAVGHRAAFPEVGRVGEAHDHAGQEARAGIVGVDHPPQHVPERGPRGRGRGGLGEELLDGHLLGEIAEGLVEMPAHLLLVVSGYGPDVDVDVDHVG